MKWGKKWKNFNNVLKFKYDENLKCYKKNVSLLQLIYQWVYEITIDIFTLNKVSFDLLMIFKQL